ncbi:MAG TPA: hypothetical protein VKI65_17195, partial [Gemmataceae bacterium]|nr:hypothetical protein [Gemmataceae bacterium]
YKAERMPTEPPKGTYTFVAQCGLSGVILGPPNYHDYQNKLRKLHAERFSRMPFDAYKWKVRIVKDEAVVKKWIEDQSWKTEYVCLNVPEPKTLGSREEVEKHFREVHLTNIIRAVESHTLNGAAAQQLPAPVWRQLLRKAWDEQARFPLKVVNVLSQQFAAHGLQFFKVNKTITHVAVARPHHLDLVATPVSDGVRRIVEFIDANPGCTRRQLIEALVPSAAPSPAETAQSPAEGTPPAAAGPGAANEPTPEQTAVIADLHWLIHQGHVLEFANGKIETAKKPNPKPAKPQSKAEEASGEYGARAEVTAEQPSRQVPQTAAPAAASAETSIAPAHETLNAAVTPAGEGSAEAAPAETPTEGY